MYWSEYQERRMKGCLSVRVYKGRDASRDGFIAGKQWG